MAFLPLLAAIALQLGSAAGSAEARIVRGFVDAYNARDYAAMEAAMATDAKWYAVEGGKIATEGDGRAAILAWTRNYLGKSCTSCRSRLLSLAASGRFVTTVELASWTAKSGGCLSQSGVAIYEVAQGRIKHVWYYPASRQMPCSAPRRR